MHESLRCRLNNESGGGFRDFSFRRYYQSPFTLIATRLATSNFNINSAGNWNFTFPFVDVACLFLSWKFRNLFLLHRCRVVAPFRCIFRELSCDKKGKETEHETEWETPERVLRWKGQKQLVAKSDKSKKKGEKHWVGIWDFRELMSCELPELTYRFESWTRETRKFLAIIKLMKRDSKHLAGSFQHLKATRMPRVCLRLLLSQHHRNLLFHVMRCDKGIQWQSKGTRLKELKLNENIPIQLHREELFSGLATEIPGVPLLKWNIHFWFQIVPHTRTFSIVLVRHTFRLRAQNSPHPTTIAVCLNFALLVFDLCSKLVTLSRISCYS